MLVAGGAGSSPRPSASAASLSCVIDWFALRASQKAAKRPARVEAATATA